MIPPDDRFPNRKSRRAGKRGRISLVLNILLREAALGVLLWGGAAEQASLRALLYVIGLGGVVICTRHFGLTRPVVWRAVLAESVTLYAGSVCVANLLLAGFGLAPWWRGP